MIGFLTGKVYIKNNESIILQVNGVGYLVAIPLNSLNSFILNQNLDLFIYTNVKDDAIELYGFKTQEELILFKLVLGVSGIGPKTALSVLDKGAVSVRNAIAKADVDFFMTIHRLGQKNAQRVIIELKNKIGGVNDLDLSSNTTEMTEIVDALKSMGYTHNEAVKAVKLIPTSDLSLEQKITLALKSIGKTKIKS